jgi:DMSO reductase anchor subunit
MHPAFSVIFFSTLSGLGYGIWFWTALKLATPRGAHAATVLAALLLLAVIPVVAGLLSSLLHLGKPLRAWRAFSQWRTSWLSREGVSAIATFVPWCLLACAFLFDSPDYEAMLLPVLPWLLGTLALLSLATVVCTAMIYASLKPVPAWRHGAVVPTYLLFALLTGGLVVVAALSSEQRANEPWAILVMAALLAATKLRYWRDIDRGELPVDRSSALGLPSDRSATVFERPHTEANYLTREMGFVVARKHARKLRAIALVLFAVVPALAGALAMWMPALATPVLAVAAVSALLGAGVERWLFFAEAKHLVTLYY